ncbi:MAG: hypothetical protein J2P49_08840, partial [Methylocapsa sp.]|nr:hypothetical protein [Methylocapsa sp.]
MAYRVLALIFAAALGLCSAALAKEHCAVGQVYFRSKHICVSKGTPVALKIYHYRPPASKARDAAIQRHARRPGKGAAAIRPQTPREAVLPAKVPVPPRREAAMPARVPLPPRRATLTANTASGIPLPPPRPAPSGAAVPPGQ